MKGVKTCQHTRGPQGLSCRWCLCVDASVSMKESLSQALNITATYEGRLKCKKTIAIFPHSPIESFHELFKVCSVAISAVIWSDTTLPIFPEWLVTLIHLQDWLTSPHTNQKWHLLKYQRLALLNDLYLNHGQIARLSELQVLPRLYGAPVFDVC